MDQSESNIDQKTKECLEPITNFSNETIEIVIDEKRYIQNQYYFLNELNVRLDIFDGLNVELKERYFQRLIDVIRTFKNEIYLNKLGDIASDKELLRFYLLVFTLIWNLSDANRDLCLYFHDTNSLKLLFDLIISSDFTAWQTKKGSWSINVMHKMYQATLGTIHNLSNYSYKYLDLWKECQSQDILIKKSIELENNDNFLMVIYLAIANIFNEEKANSENLASVTKVIQKISQLIGNASVNLKENRINRCERSLYQNDDKKYSIIKISNFTNTWILSELIDGLYRLSIIDRIKQFIFEECKLNEYLETIIYHGNMVEKDFALKLLWQLCFDEKIKQIVKQNKELVEYIAKLVGEENDENKNFLKNAKGLIWLLDNHKSESDLPTSEGHLMISYNRESRDLCLLIKSRLEALNHKIWIDVESIHGSSLESMADAIEKSKCVLICMTEKYKLSSNCRAEAEYAFNLNKKIIPLIMQKGYKPNGWLGIILGSKIFIDYTKYEFDECMKRLEKELELTVSLSNINEVEKKTVNISNNECYKMIPPKRDRIHPTTLNWKAEQVSNWMNEKNFHHKIVCNVAPCDGETLHQILDLEKRVPEFFYNSLVSANELTLKDIAYFVKELKKLFPDEKE